MSMKNKTLVNIAIIGAGSGVASQHHRAFSDLPNARVVAAVEPLDDRRVRLGAEWGIPMFRTAEELAASGLPIDLAVICVRDADHPTAVRHALDAGWHVLCEKPLALNAREAGELFRRASDRHRYLGVSLQRRHMMPELQALAHNGGFGRIWRVDTRWRRHRGAPLWRMALKGRGGVLADLGVHLLSHALPFFESPPVQVTTHGWNHMTGAQVEDDAFVVVDFAGGELLTVHASFDCNIPPYGDDVTLEVVGSLAQAKVELLTVETAEEAAAKAPVVWERTADGVVPRPMRRLRTTPECHTGVAADTLSAVLNGEPATAEVLQRELGLMVLLDAIYESLEQGGRPIRLAYPTRAEAAHVCRGPLRPQAPGARRVQEPRHVEAASCVAPCSP